MSAKLTKSSKTKKRVATRNAPGNSARSRARPASPDRPFEADILKRAREITARDRLVLEPDPELGFIGRSLELPTVFADGKTADACVAATREALETAVATMLEMGQAPPAPAERGVRQAQVNIRLTAEEKLLLEESARRRGFRGISDFVRAAALNSVGGPPRK